MKKEIEDYLPFYIGCEVLLISDISEDYVDDTYETPEVGSIGKFALINNGSFQINCGSESEDWHYGVAFKECYIALWGMKDFKLLLRPLSDMTKEEKKEYLSIIGEPQMYRDGFFYLGEYGFLNIRNNNITASFGFNPESIKYLLSKHFDLFGLIEAGLAIDKTTLKETAKL